MKGRIGKIAAQRIYGGTQNTRVLRYLDQQTLYVDPGGTGDYLTIQAAIDAVLAGTLLNRVILVAPGTYIENLSFSAYAIAGLTIKAQGRGPVKVQGSVAAALAVVTITGVCTGLILTLEDIQLEQLAPATALLTCNATGVIDVAFVNPKFTAQANTDLFNWIPGAGSTLSLTGGLRGKREYCLCGMTIAGTAGVHAIRLADLDLAGALTLNDADIVAVMENFKVGGNLVVTVVNAVDGLAIRNSHIVGSVTITAGQVFINEDTRVEGAYTAGLPNVYRNKKALQAYTTGAGVALTEAEVAQYGLILIAGAHAVTLPPASVALAGRMLLVSSNNAAGTLVVAAGFHGGGAGADTITIGVGCGVIAYCDGTNWYSTVAALAPA